MNHRCGIDDSRYRCRTRTINSAATIRPAVRNLDGRACVTVRIHVVCCVVEYLDRREAHDGDVVISSSKVAWFFCQLTLTGHH